MDNAQEKAVPDGALDAARAEGEKVGEIRGEIKGKIELICTLQGILCDRRNPEGDLREMGLERLEALASQLKERAFSRYPPEDSIERQKSRLKKIRDSQWAINAARAEGEAEGEVRSEIKGETEPPWPTP